MKARAIPHQPPTRGDNTVSVAQGGTATKVIFTVDDFLDQRDPSTATIMKEVHRLHGELC